MNKKILIISTITLIIDQLSKNLIDAYILLNESINIIPNIFNITNVNNYGAAWSLFNNKTYFLIGITLVVLIMLIRYVNTFKENTRNIISFGLLFGGIMGNLIDRLFLGYVRDFISINLFSYNFPVFNISDISIVIGTLLLIIAIIKGEENEVHSTKRKYQNR